ncbi:hypothetical protein EWM64_g4946 [Hericium alpestre]|uniref:Post-SET domain-containing protein n=1 Tax=Hericium alpestre TaxID=135208 RepID=A0A4Y9ZZW6_9AGAM|nr:hypothetical protein EWM64_g4946 [Hericium alpestre]
MKPTQESYTPSHPGLFAVAFKPGAFSSACIAQKDFKAGETIARLEGLTVSPRSYTTVQCGPGPEDHIELNSDLVYVNHSCEPNVAFDLSSPDRTQWHARALKPIHSGEPLTFFYPSTEWHMDQPFDCTCGTPSCLGKVQGAAFLKLDELTARGFVSPWIVDAVKQRDASPLANSGAAVHPALQNPTAKATTDCESCGLGYAGGANVCGCRPPAY